MVNSYCLIKTKYINLFAAFDIYYKNKVSYRENKFYNSEGDEVYLKHPFTDSTF